MRSTCAWISEGQVQLEGILEIPDSPEGLVIFALDHGCSRFNPRIEHTANELHKNGLATFLFEPFSAEENNNHSAVFDIPLLADRLKIALQWIRNREECSFLPRGLFASGTVAGAALWAAADLGEEISAVACQSGRPDLAGYRLGEVHAPTLLLVGSEDPIIVALNRMAQKTLPHGTLQIIQGAGHLFGEPKFQEQAEKIISVFFLHQLKARESSRVA